MWKVEKAVESWKIRSSMFEPPVFQRQSVLFFFFLDSWEVAQLIDCVTRHGFGGIVLRRCRLKNTHKNSYLLQTIIAIIILESMIISPTSPTPLVNLSRDFSKLYNNRSQADIVIFTGTPDPTPFYAHSLFLQCRSVYFDMVLADRSNVQRNNDGLIEFELPHVNKHAFAMLLRYFYSGTVDWVMGFTMTEAFPLKSYT